MAFDEARIEPFRIICAPWGREKEGKTHVALTFPEPIYYINLDMGLEGVIDEFLNSGKRIYKSTIKYGLLNGVTNAQALGQFETDYFEGITKAAPEGGTVVVDTFTQIRQLVDAVKLDEVRQRKSKKQGKDADDVQILSMDYAEANLTIGSYIRSAWDLPGLNLVLVHRAAKVYDSQGRETNAIKLQGWGEVPAAVGMTFQMSWDPEQNKFVAFIDSCRANYRLRGFKIPDPSYEVFSALLNPNPVKA